MAFFTLGELQNQYLVFGTVDIADGAAIAPHSILGADGNSQLKIAAGACLGSEVVIQARWGSLTIEAGANIGSGVLIIGHGIIGSGACIGAGSTLINPQIGPQQVVSPNSLVGTGCSTEAAASPANASAANPPEPSAAANGQPEPAGNPEHNGNGNGNGSGPSPEHLMRVYGKDHVSRMLDSLFPHRRLDL